MCAEYLLEVKPNSQVEIMYSLLPINHVATAVSLSVSASKGSDKLHRQTFPPALNNTWCCFKKKLPTTEFQQKRKWTMLKSTIFVFFFSCFLGRLDCAGKPFVPVKINLSDRGSVDHSVWLYVYEQKSSTVSVVYCKSECIDEEQM